MWARLLQKQVKSYLSWFTDKFNSFYALAIKKVRVNSVRLWAVAIQGLGRVTILCLRLVIIALIVLIAINHVNYILCESHLDIINPYSASFDHNGQSLFTDSNENLLLSLAGCPVGTGVRITGWKKHKRYPGVLVFRAKNVDLLERYQALESLFKALTNHKRFKSLGEFKVIRVNVCTEEGQEWSIHPNTLIKPDTTFQDYYNEVKSKINHFYDQHYTDDTFNTYLVTAMGTDHLREKRIAWKITDTHMEVTGIEPLNSSPSSDSNSISNPSSDSNPNAGGLIKANSSNISKRGGVGTSEIRKFSTVTYNPVATGTQRALNSYTKLTRWDKNLLSFAVVDIECIQAPSRVGPKPSNKIGQIPIAISAAWPGHRGMSHLTKSELFLIDYDRVEARGLNLETTGKIFKDYFNFVIKLAKDKNIYIHFSHNLSYDGYFILKYLHMFYPPKDIKLKIDKNQKFVSIELHTAAPDSHIIIWKDSLRLFPLSLADLTKVMGLPGKTEAYNKDEFGSLDLFKCKDTLNRFKDYSLNDSISLYRAILKAQEHYQIEYLIDICKLYSLPGLALKVFRMHFIPEEIDAIPSLDKNPDIFIRRGYFGGGVHLYKEHGKKVYYYDVNSLYPYAQCNPMPFKNLGWRKEINSLDNFFGFCLAEIICPMNITKPMLPYSTGGKTVFPTGSWTGTYFSEELKAAQKLGYKVKPIRGYEFSKAMLFCPRAYDYVDHFYSLKANSEGSERYLAKLMLNSLYGLFGRGHSSIKPYYVATDSYVTANANREIITEIQINNKLSLILVDADKFPKVADMHNGEIEINCSDFNLPVKSNVAIAAAVTAYARIHMIPLLLNDSVLYSDTDSIFTTHPLPDHLIGPDLGQIKDELRGVTIDEAYFLGHKQYGYTYKEWDGSIIDKSVWAGVTRDTLSFRDITWLAGENVLQKTAKDRFFRKLSDLTINVRDIEQRLARSQVSIDNKYTPPHIGPRAE